jgi:hypothetical protein
MPKNKKLPKGFKNVLVLDTIEAKLPKKINDEIFDIWQYHCLINDYCFYKFTEYDAEAYPNTWKYLQENGVSECYIHNWW